MNNSLFEKATYSPEDNKLRLYLAGEERLPQELYAKVKEHGFVYAPLQKLFVAPAWNPNREDFCLTLVGEIVAEGTTFAERAEAKAARLDALAEKRAAEANGFKSAANRLSQNLVCGQPILIGHHSERKARKDQEKLENLQQKYLSLAAATDYWSYRAEGVERHVNKKASFSTRTNRMKTLLADLRTYQRYINHGYFVAELWLNLSKTEDETKKRKAFIEYSGMYFKDGAMVPNGLRDKVKANEISIDDAYQEGISFGEKRANSQWYIRFIQHVLNRLAYEQQELGWNVGRYEGKLTAAILQTFVRTHGGDSPKAKKVENGWRLETDVPLPIQIGDGKVLECTEDKWRDLMMAVGYEVPAPKPKKPPILNLDIEAVTIPQLYSNSNELQTLKIVKMTKAEYAELHKDSKEVKYSSCGQFRIKVCRNPDPTVEFFKRELVAVFLVDSIKHETPETSAIVSLTEMEAA